MFSPTDDKKLDWMYKGPNAMVNREDYLLGRAVDKTLEQLNAEENEKKIGIVPPKNHVEHECIPPSIRDYNKIVQAEQVDLSAKLQEDPLVAIKKREEETRRQFLQNPVQLKKLQKALKAQEVKRLKKHRKRSKSADSSDSDIDRKLSKKLLLLKSAGSLPVDIPTNSKKKSKSKVLDTILMHKFNQLKDKLSDEDLKNILALDGLDSSSEDERFRKDKRQRKEASSSDSDEEKNKSRFRNSHYAERSAGNSRTESTRMPRDTSRTRSLKDKPGGKYKTSHNYKESREDRYKSKRTDNFSNNDSDDTKKYKYPNMKGRPKGLHSNSDSDDDNSKKRSLIHSHNERSEIKTWGLVKSDGTKIPLNRKISEDKTLVKSKLGPTKTEYKYSKRKQTQKLTEEEKEKRRKEMLHNADWRDKERSANVQMYREKDKREEADAAKTQYNRDLVHHELVKSTAISSVEARIKSNLNNIQRSSSHMNTHFSKR